MSEIIHFQIKGDSIELFKLLKATGVCESGGQAKECINQGMVLLEGTVETQKAKKVLRGQTVEFQDEKILVE